MSGQNEMVDVKDITIFEVAETADIALSYGWCLGFLTCGSKDVTPVGD